MHEKIKGNATLYSSSRFHRRKPPPAPPRLHFGSRRRAFVRAAAGPLASHRRSFFREPQALHGAVADGDHNRAPLLSPPVGIGSW
jgi:hypothetical protein